MATQFSLNDPWFELVKEGKKIYEGRRKTEKVMGLVKGQVIEFRHHVDSDRGVIRRVVEDIIEFPSFHDALIALPIEQVLPLEDITVEKGVEIYKRYVSLETQQKDGVVMIKLKTVE